MPKKTIITAAHAPKAIGSYSQAIRAGKTVYLSGQIGLDPVTMELVKGIMSQLHQAFTNMKAVAVAAGGTVEDVVKLTVYLTDMGCFPVVNQVMGEYFAEPYPARSVVGVRELPKGALVELEAILVLD